MAELKITEVKEVSTPVVEQEVAPVSNLSGLALGIAKLPNREWGLVSLKFDPSTGEAGLYKVLRADSSRDIIVEAFRIQVGKTNFFMKESD